MFDLQKRILAWVGIAVIVIFGIFLVVTIKQDVNTATTTNTVSFTGEGKVVAKPDVAVADISIVTQAATSKAAQDDNSKKSQAITDFLKKQKIDEKDIQTTGYNILPQYRYSPYGTTPPTITGYEVTQTTEVKIRNLDNVSAVLDGVVSAGANQVTNLSFQIDNPEQLKADARAKAIQDAKDKAKVLENQIGIKLGKIINFSENVGGYPVPVYNVAKSDYGVGGGGTAPAISTGENEITVDISLTYQIK